MRFLLIPAPASTAQPQSEQPFDESVFIAHMKYNEEMHRAGVLVAAEGLSPNARGAHVVVSPGKRAVVIDGPFAETKELIAGFYLIEVASREEAIEWAMRYPGNFFGGDEVLEIRQLTGASDIPDHLLQLIHTAAPTWSASFSKSE